MAEIIEFRPARTELDDQIFNAVCEMQEDLRALDEFADALAPVSETMDESPHANAINRLTFEIKHRAQSVERRRDDLLRLIIFARRGFSGLDITRILPACLSGSTAEPRPRLIRLVTIIRWGNWVQGVRGPISKQTIR
jgi:hypothetical protein